MSGMSEVERISFIKFYFFVSVAPLLLFLIKPSSLPLGKVLIYLSGPLRISSLIWAATLFPGHNISFQCGMSRSDYVQCLRTFS